MLVRRDYTVWRGRLRNTCLLNPIALGERLGRETLAFAEPLDERFMTPLEPTALLSCTALAERAAAICFYCSSLRRFAPNGRSSQPFVRWRTRRSSAE